jgi:hypothetical protein
MLDHFRSLNDTFPFALAQFGRFAISKLMQQNPIRSLIRSQTVQSEPQSMQQIVVRI